MPPLPEKAQLCYSHEWVLLKGKFVKECNNCGINQNEWYSREPQKACLCAGKRGRNSGLCDKCKSKCCQFCFFELENGHARTCKLYEVQDVDYKFKVI